MQMKAIQMVKVVAQIQPKIWPRLASSAESLQKHRVWGRRPQIDNARQRQLMNRLFGKKKPEAPQVNINDVGSKVDGRVTNLDGKVCYCERAYGSTSLELMVAIDRQVGAGNEKA